MFWVDSMSRFRTGRTSPEQGSGGKHPESNGGRQRVGGRPYTQKGGWRLSSPCSSPVRGARVKRQTSRQDVSNPSRTRVGGKRPESNEGRQRVGGRPDTQKGGWKLSSPYSSPARGGSSEVTSLTTRYEVPLPNKGRREAPRVERGSTEGRRKTLHPKMRVETSESLLQPSKRGLE